MSRMTVRSRARTALLTSAAAGVMWLQLGTAAMAYSSVDLNLLDQNYTHLSLATALIDNYQFNDPSGAVDAVASTFSGAIDVINELTESGFSVLSGTFETSDNTISGTAYSNKATNTISASSTPAFADSSAIANLQVNEADVTATSDGAQIMTLIESTGSGGSDYRTLTGTVTMDGNTIATSATGNTAANTINVADSVDLTGDVTLNGYNDNLFYLDDLYNNSNDITDLQVEADLAIVNAQSNFGSGGLGDVYSEVNDAWINAKVESVSGATIAMKDNTISASAMGSHVTSSVLTGENAATIDTTIALSSLQLNDGMDVTALNDNATIYAEGGYPNSSGSYYSGGFHSDDSSLTIDTATISALAYGNDAVQTLELNANSVNGTQDRAAYVDMYYVSGAGFGSGSYNYSGSVLDVEGGATVTNLQLRDNSVTTATVNAGDIIAWITESESGSMTNDTVLVKDANFDATAVGNRGVTQAVTLTGNTVGTAVAAVSYQAADGNSSVNAMVSNTNAAADAEDEYLVDSSLTLEGGLTRALAINNAAATSIDVSANDVPVLEDQGSGVVYLSSLYWLGYDGNANNGPYGESSSIEASFIANNVQTTDADTTARVMDAENYVWSDDYTSGSSMLNTDNQVLAAAIGNDASTGVTLSLNTVTTIDGGDSGSSAGMASLASAVNMQNSFDNLVEAQAFSSGHNNSDIFNTTTEYDVTDSTMSTENNTVQALAIANRSTGTTVTINANALDTAYDGSGATPGLLGWYGSVGLASNLAMSSQFTSGSTVVSNLTNASGANSATESMEIRTTADDVSGSTLSSNDNNLLASSIGNAAVTTATIDVSTELASSTGVSNWQAVDDSGIVALVGANSTSGGGVVNATLDGGVSAGVWTSYNLVSSYSAEQIAAIQSAYPALTVSGGYWTFNTIGSGYLGLDYSYTSNGTLSREGGVYVKTTGSVINSTIDVLGNLTAGSVTGNEATNTLDVSAGLSTGSTAAGNDAYAGMTMGVWVEADAAINNMQYVSNSNLVSDVYGNFGIESSGGAYWGSSTFTVDGNTQQSTATGNKATSALTIDANDLESTAGVANYQSETSDVSALSDLWLFSPVAVDDSTVSIADNRNLATATGNIGVNSIELTATNMDVWSSDNGHAQDDEAIAAAALYSNQYADGSISADVVTDAFNAHDGDWEAGITNSTVLFDGNVSVAEATANRVTNTVTLDATNASYDAISSNYQHSDATVDADATASIDVRMTVDVADTAVDDSSISVSGNVTQAKANGNVAVNSMALNAVNVTGGYQNATAGEGRNLDASYGVMNSQDNHGDVSAHAYDVSYQIDLNPLNGDDVGALNGSTAAVDNNSVLAQAVGNSSSNSLTVSALSNDSANYAVSNSQYNSGAISASVTNATVGVNALGGVADSTSSVNGNTLGATAIGNSATNVLSR